MSDYSNRTISLRQIIPKNVWQKYTSGDFSQYLLEDLTTPEKLNSSRKMKQPLQKIQVKKEEIPETQSNGEKDSTLLVSEISKEEIYALSDHTGSSIIIVDMNTQVVKNYNENGKIKNNGRCLCCFQEYQEPVGIPYRLVTYINKDGHLVKVFYIDILTCSFECAFQWVKDYMSRPVHIRHSGHESAESLLKDLFRTMYPGKKFPQAAGSVHLLRTFQGPLSSKDSRTGYIRMKDDRMRIVPTVIPHLRMK